jgi:hypothetical protein
VKNSFFGINVFLLCVVGALCIGSFSGCQNFTTPTTQPTVAGVTAADFAAKTYTTVANLEASYAASGKLTASQAATAKAADNAAYAAIQSAGTSALSGASGLTALETTTLAAFEDAVNNPQP